ncbi:hypothetical protein H0H93_009354 [Arthromyces matolae]|nr:hypothetical protein H0H93_009354 [Arthromyces matolae]
MSRNLRDTLLNALSHLPGVREFHLNVLITAPRKNASIFPFARPKPRAYLQDILILLSEQSTPDAPHIFVTAIEANIYNIPQTKSAILYVSKVDSTGQASAPSPTRCLVHAFLSYYVDPKTRPEPLDAVENFWVHLFARAQSQYLFPNSAEFEGKRPLSDVKLCSWWKRLFSDVERELTTKTTSKARLYYVLPGYDEPEAIDALKNAGASYGSNSSWIYGHPYSQTEIPLPCPPDSSEVLAKNLGHYIPSFDDDPKSRFLDEIAYTTVGEVNSPRRKRKRTESREDVDVSIATSTSIDRAKEGAEMDSKNKEDGKEQTPLGELKKVSPDEFWERMSFRQECVAGAITGFFTLGIATTSTKSVSETSMDRTDDDAPQPHGSSNTTRSAVSPLAPQPGQVSSPLKKRVITNLTTNVEFSTVERAIRATEIIEGAIRGLCEGIKPVPTKEAVIVARTGTGTRAGDLDRRTPEPDHETSTLLAPPSTPPRRRVGFADVSPNPFPEPETSLETYLSHIYGSVSVSNEKRERVEATTETVPVVTVLTARKKKKRID